jgi:transcriptional regulator with XRE-family HTH domain
MSRILPCYLNTLRMRRGLTQPELAELMGIGASLLSKVESLERRPTTKVILAAEIVFGMPAREIFPGAYKNLEQGVVKRARALRSQFLDRSDPAAAEKLRLIDQIMERSVQS